MRILAQTTILLGGLLLVASTTAFAARPRAPQALHQTVQREMEESIHMGTTPSLQVFLHNGKIKSRTSRAPNYNAETDSPTTETWAKFRITGPRAAASKGKLTVKMRALLPVSGHVYRPGTDSLSTARRFAKSTLFRLVLVHEDGSFEKLGMPQANGLVTPVELALNLRRGRNLLVMLPVSTANERPTFVWKYRSGRVAEFVWGTPGKNPIFGSPMHLTLKQLGVDPFPPPDAD